MPQDIWITDLLADPLVASALAAGRRPRVGVSACLLGEHVRYDGDHRRVALLADLLPQFVDCMPLCPEVAIGLGVPRPAIQRVRLRDGRERVRGVVDSALDVTEALGDYARQVAATQVLHGYVFKARSPSCAPGSAPLHDEQGRVLEAGWGLYAGRLRDTWPGLPVGDEEELAESARLAGFLRAVFRRAGA